MIKLFILVTVMLLSFGIVEQNEKHTITFDIRDIMNMNGSSDLINSDGQVVGKITLAKKGLKIDDLVVDKIDGLYQTLEPTNKAVFFNASMSKIRDTRKGGYTWKRNMLSGNKIVWSNGNNIEIELGASIGRGDIVIELEGDMDPDLQAMFLMERIHHVRALLISNFSYF